MKKILALLLALMPLLVLCACGEEEAVETPTIKIGVFESLSGVNGTGGKQEYLGIQFAHSETPRITVGGVTYDIALIPVDNASSAENAGEAAQKLLEEGVAVVLGSYGSDVSLAASDTFKAAGVAVVGASCTSPSITQGNDHYFRICLDDSVQGPLLAEFAAEKLEAETVYCLGQQGNAYDQGLIEAFRTAAEMRNMRVVTALFPENCTNFTAYLTSAVTEGAELIFAPVSLEYAERLVEQAAELALEIPLLGGDTWDSPVILDAAAERELTIYASSFYAEGGDSGFDAAIKAWMNENSSALVNNGGSDSVAAVTAMGYDAYHTALAAIKAAASADRADILAALPGVTYTGVTGTIAFDESGNALRDSCYVKCADPQNGSWEPVSKQRMK